MPAKAAKKRIPRCNTLEEGAKAGDETRVLRPRPAQKKMTLSKKGASSRMSKWLEGKTTQHPFYIGVRCRHKGSPKVRWYAEMRGPNGTRLCLGPFILAEHAARAYDAEVIRIRGPNAKRNFLEFPGHTWHVTY